MLSSDCTQFLARSLTQSIALLTVHRRVHSREEESFVMLHLGLRLIAGKWAALVQASMDLVAVAS